MPVSYIPILIGFVNCSAASGCTICLQTTDNNAFFIIILLLNSLWVLNKLSVMFCLNHNTFNVSGTWIEKEPELNLKICGQTFKKLAYIP